MLATARANAEVGPFHPGNRARITERNVNTVNTKVSVANLPVISRNFTEPIQNARAYRSTHTIRLGTRGFQLPGTAGRRSETVSILPARLTVTEYEPPAGTRDSASAGP